MSWHALKDAACCVGSSQTDERSTIKCELKAVRVQIETCSLKKKKVSIIL